jgi:hypothetical protein
LLKHGGLAEFEINLRERFFLMLDGCANVSDKGILDLASGIEAQKGLRMLTLKMRWVQVRHKTTISRLQQVVRGLENLESVRFESDKWQLAEPVIENESERTENNWYEWMNQSQRTFQKFEKRKVEDKGYISQMLSTYR